MELSWLKYYFCLKLNMEVENRMESVLFSSTGVTELLESFFSERHVFCHLSVITGMKDLVSVS